MPIDVGISEACSRTLDFAFADAASAVVAQQLRHHKEARELRERSRLALRQLFDPKTELMGHRKKNLVGALVGYLLLLYENIILYYIILYILYYSFI